MAITIDWPNSIINIPKADTTLIQSVPTEIRELNLNVFRLTLKDLEDDADGMGFQKTHDHNTEVTVGGVTLARVVNILDPYTITFEDGQYAVNLVGSNSNVGDKVNVNQVSIRSANSAGMTSSADIEFASYEGGVTVDITSSTTGTVHPAGTKRAPVNNLTDAMVIANYRGLSKIYIIGDLYVDNYGDYEGMEFIGESITKSNVGIDTDASVLRCEFSNMTISGVLDGNSLISNSKILDLNYVTGTIQNSILGPGTITLAAGASNILDCYGAVEGYTQNILDLGGSGKALSLNNFSGEMSIINKTCFCPVDLQLNQGFMFLDETIVSGVVQVRGIGTVVDNTADEVTVETDDLLNKTLISTAVWDENISAHTIDGTAGGVATKNTFGGAVWVDADGGVSGIDFPIGTSTNPVNNMLDAGSIASGMNLSNFKIRGRLELCCDNTDASFEGLGSVENDIIYTNGQAIGNTRFERVTISGVTTGTNIQFVECILNDLSGIDGLMFNCGLAGTIGVGNENSILMGKACIAMNEPTVIDMVGSNRSALLDIDGGNIKYINATTGSYIQTSQTVGRTELASTCTGGTAIVRGHTKLTDNSSMTVVDDTIQTTFYESEPS